MKIGIVGNYGNDNNGDEAILLSIIEQLLSTFSIKSKDITVFSNNPAQTAERYGVDSYPLYYKNGNAVKTFIKTYKLNKKYVASFDLLVIGGGGILMDLYKREAPLYGSYAMMAKHSGTSYVVYGCGAGPLNTSLGKWFINYMCKHADSVSVRDPQSKQLLESIGVKKSVTVIGDPAFTLKREGKVHAVVPRKIGVTAVPYYNANYWPEGNEEKYDAYISSMARNLDNLSAEREVEITFFATKYPQDAAVTKDILAKMTSKDNVLIIDRNLPPQDILDITKEQDIVIGTRLHSLILATDTQTPIIAVSYHKKVNDFMQLANLGEYCFSMDAVEHDETLFAGAFSKMAQDWEETVENTKKVSAHLNKEALKGVSQFQKAVNSK